MHALHRFGIPQHFIDMIHAIYSSRMFFVHDQQHSSDAKHSHFGISQGCPLSPMLFIIMMIVLIPDARDDLIAAIGDEAKDVHAFLFADDTLIVDETGKHAEAYMHCIQPQGACYGLSLNWDKLMMICINYNLLIAKLNRSHVRITHSMIYLRGLISDDNAITSELSRRIGMASDYSRISNIQALKESSSILLSSLLAQRQLMLFGKIACKDHALNPIHTLVFNSADSFDPPHMNWQRKRRRPRLTWSAEVNKLALNILRNRTNLHQLLYDL